MDRGERDDGEGAEIGVYGARREGGLELAIPCKLIVGELFSRTFYFLLHEKKFLHSSKFLGIGWSGKNPTDVVDREARLPRWSQRSRTLPCQASAPGKEKGLGQLTTSTMYSVNISSITFTASFAGLRSSPNPYIKFRTGTEFSPFTAFVAPETLTFFRKQPFQIRLALRSRGKTPRPRVSASTGGVYRVCIACRRVCGRKIGSPGGRAAGGWGPGDSRRRRPMLWRHVGVVRPRRAISGDRGGRVRVGRVRSRCLGVRCWSVSVGIGSRLTWVVVGHAETMKPLGRHAINISFLAPQKDAPEFTR